MAEERKRELALPPGTFACVLDSTKGVVKLFVGPTVINQSGQDRPVKFNPKTFEFDDCSLEAAMQKSVVVPEGFYAVLTNPAKSSDGKTIVYPQAGRAQDTPDLSIGLKENIPGPVNFALYPGQTCEIRRGHHLRSNEYLLIKIYNEEKAKDNWSKAVLKIADPTTTSGGQGADSKPQLVATKAPTDLAVGKQYTILGTEIAFYIPPTGVSVVAESQDENGKAVFVRAAETLEQLEYAILVDEDGNKRYPKGPTVVFPKPTERFLTDQQGNRKFRAIEMNELQGIQLKFITDGELHYADGTTEAYKAGDEKFVTGAKMPIYYPEEGHQLVKYDGKTIHYAAAVPEGEARYVMDRKNGEIRTAEGPTMLLPNPVNEIIVRRALSDFESITWFPGADGKGSKEALDYNRWLRNQASKEPTTRQGVVSEGNVERNAPGGSALYAADVGIGAMSLDANLNLNASAIETRSARRTSTKSFVPESRQGKNQDAMVGDVAERKSTYNEPRTITFANKYKGVPTIKVQQGYAVQVANSDGDRKVWVGPKTLLLSYGETLDVLSLSTGKPKNTDALFRTAYLNIANNKVTDVVEVETADLVKVELKLVYNVNFEGDSLKWFAIENYVKHLCDRVRSMLKGKVRKETIEKFYANATDTLRDAILGVSSKETGASRPGWSFPENGMRVTDVEVLSVRIADAGIGQMLAQVQHQVVQQNIQLAQAKSRLDAVKQHEQINREEAATKFETTQRTLDIQTQTVAEGLKLELAKLAANAEQHVQGLKIRQAEQEVLDFVHGADLARKKAESEQADAFAAIEQERWLKKIKAQTDAIAEQMKSVTPQLVASLDSVSSRETLIKVAKELGFHQIFGGENVSDFLAKLFTNTPLQGLMEKALASAGSVNGKASTQPVA